MKMKRWKFVASRKRDVIALKISKLVQELPYEWERREVTARALAFSGDWDLARRLKEIK